MEMQEKNPEEFYPLVKTIEARSKAGWLPSLHLSFYRRPDNSIMCHCLDFDLRAYSSVAVEADAIQEAFEGVQELAMWHIVTHIVFDNLSAMFEDYHYDEMQGRWLRFAKSQNLARAQTVQQGYNRFMDSIREESQEVVGGADLSTVSKEELKRLVKDYRAKLVESSEQNMEQSCRIDELSRQNHQLAQENQELINLLHQVGAYSMAEGVEEEDARLAGK